VGRLGTKVTLISRNCQEWWTHPWGQSFLTCYEYTHQYSGHFLHTQWLHSVLSTAFGWGCFG